MRLKQSAPEEYIFTDSELNRLGYHLQREGLEREAFEVFRLNAAEYPEVANVFDSLGEACMRAGDRESAILNYRKALELDPESRNAAEMLERLTEE